MGRRADSDEHYVIGLCDEVIGAQGQRQAMFPWLVGDASPKTGRTRMLPVDGYWPTLKLVIEFQGKQHTVDVPFFDRRLTISGVSRGAQRRLYDERKREILPQHGIHLVIIHKSEFTTRADKIVRDHKRDLAVVRARLDWVGSTRDEYPDSTA